MEKEKFERICPSCKKVLGYANKKNRNKAEKKNSICGSCRAKINQNNPEHKKKMSLLRSSLFRGKNNPFYGKHHTEETKKKVAKTKAGRIYPVYQTKEFKEKSSRPGKLNGMYGKTVYGVWIEKYGKEEADKRMCQLKARTSVKSKGKNNPMYGRPSPQGSGNGWSGWYNGWYFRSLKELSYMINVIEKNKYKWESAETKRLSIKYINYDGSERTYRADFFIDEKILIEIKPKKLMETPNNILKKNAAIDFCKKNNFEYRMVDIKLLPVNEINVLVENKKIKFNKKYEKKWRSYYADWRRKNNIN
jgi:hypothetical protein